MNCAYGWCAIQALGDFNHKRGGHLILEDLKLVIEFPSSAVILIPSATLTHANVPVGLSEGEREPPPQASMNLSKEKRASFTQYCPGGLLRYVDNGFRTQSSIKRKTKAYNEMMARRDGRWEMGISMYWTVEELAKYPGSSSLGN